MASQGPTSAGTGANDTSYGSVAWQTPTRITSSDDSKSDVATTSGSTPSNYLKATNFGFTIPTGSTIDGILFEVEKSNAFSGFGWHVEDDRARVVKSDGTIGSTDKAIAGNWSSTEAYFTYGGSTELWGESWTPEDINNSNFGFVLAVRYVSGVQGPALVDHVRATIYYTEAASGQPAVKRMGGVKFATQRTSVGGMW